MYFLVVPFFIISSFLSGDNARLSSGKDALGGGGECVCVELDFLFPLQTV